MVQGYAFFYHNIRLGDLLFSFYSYYVSEKLLFIASAKKINPKGLNV